MISDIQQIFLLLCMTEMFRLIECSKAFKSHDSLDGISFDVVGNIYEVLKIYSIILIPSCSSE
jgi:hypothetical protein